MKVNIRADSVEIEGYVNAVERDSKPLWSRIGKFIERICKGAFNRALQKNDDVQILLNHDEERVLGSQKQGNLELKEDNIGLHARAVITDKEVVEKAKQNKLVGWSFGFTDTDEGVETREENGVLKRYVKDLNLFEVSILDDEHEPAYEGTLINARNTEQIKYYGNNFIDEIEVRQLEPKQHENVEKNIDYSKWDNLIQEMKER